MKLIVGVDLCICLDGISKNIKNKKINALSEISDGAFFV
jgi:hypothetical protein